EGVAVEGDGGVEVGHGDADVVDRREETGREAGLLAHALHPCTRWRPTRRAMRHVGAVCRVVPALRPAPRLAGMSALTRDDVAHLAGLARIDLSDAELDRMVGELGVILESVAKVQEVAAADIEPMSHPMP